MTSERHLYKHAETGIVSLITDRAASVFGDRLVRIEDDDTKSTEPKPRTRAPKKAADTDEAITSPKEGNE